MKTANHLSMLMLALALSLATAQNSASQQQRQLRAKPISYTFHFITVPGFAESWAGEINNAGSSLIHVFGGPTGKTYLRHRNGRLVPIVCPGEQPSIALGLNSRGDIVGDVGSPDSTYYIGFVRNRAGTFTRFAFPGLGDPLSGMQVNSINDRQQAVGGYAINGQTAAFIRQRDGTLESFQYGGGAFPYGINNRGQISGQSPVGSFIREVDGSFTVVAFDGASDTQAFGINNRGQVAGLYYTDKVHGFVRHEDGTFQTVDAPAADVTWLSDINDAGAITGTAYFAGQQTAFIGFPRWK
jgi:hypothetical protein